MSLDDLIRDRLATLVEPVDAEEVIASIEARSKPGRHRFRRPLLGTAAAVVLAVCAYGVVSMGSDRSRQLQSGPGTTPSRSTTITAVAPRSVHFTAIWSGLAGQPAGSLVAVTDRSQLDALRSAAGTPMSADRPLPSVDFERQMILVATLGPGGCNVELDFDHFDADGTTLTAVVGPESTVDCDPPDATRTRIGTLNWDETGSPFRVRLPADPDGRYPEQIIDVRKPAPTDGTPVTTEPPSTTVGVAVTTTAPRVHAEKQPPAPTFPTGPSTSTVRPHLTGRLELSTTIVPSGGSVPGVVIVNNDSGATVQIGYCFSAFSIGLRGSGAWLGRPSLACAQPGVLPVGESRWPVTIDTESVMCAPEQPPPDASGACDKPSGPITVPPGTYTTTVTPPDGATFDIPPVTIIVTPPP